ncbi:SCO2322 family protein [Streptomyces spiramenti]|uniref:Secreted protein n=1 Tax=Streptomyces spiramenti TaxID=2720606 RepID=A0ABX1AK99_9ACTN|nr:SCO2322 family protein [Streptomyces spiramenti]NJP66096.1 hypothetical protein [Streptomyces spiramenti]
MRRAVPGARRSVLVPAAGALLLPVLAGGAATGAAAPPATGSVATDNAAGGSVATDNAAGAPARDEPTGYRYWSFWLRDADDGPDDGNDAGRGTTNGAWRYATEGPGTLRPSDGALLGFRFGIGTGAGGAEQPRGGHTFESVCDVATAGEDERRVALVLDFGTRAEAPAGEEPPEPTTACAVVADGATAAEALAATADPLRYDRSGLLCAVRGYPERGCGEQASVAPEDSPDSDGGGDNGSEDGGSAGTGDDGLAGGLGLWIGIAAVAVLAVAAWGRGRRRDR